MNKTYQLQYKKLLFISSKRGMLEIENILTKFVKEFVPEFYNNTMITKLIEFLEITDDITLFNYIFKNQQVPDKYKKFIVDLKSSLGN